MTVSFLCIFSQSIHTGKVSMLLRPLLCDEPIITSVLDDDKYNFHMGNFFFHKYMAATSTYSYTCRTQGINFAPIYEDLLHQIQLMGDLKLTLDECHWLSKNSKCSDQYIDYLYKNRIFSPTSVMTTLHPRGGLTLKYTGLIQLDILREVKLLAIISELYFRHLYGSDWKPVMPLTEEWLKNQVDWLTVNAHPNFSFFEAGGRRRFSKARHEFVTEYLWSELPKDEMGKPKYMMGTSNCHLGMKYNIPTFGTQAHQLYMFMQTVTHPALSQIKALSEWYEFYKGDLSIALSDTLGDIKWDKDFKRGFQMLYAGQRHDSGNPYTWADSRLESYEKWGIDTKTKSLTFGDSLNWETANELTKTYSDRINVNSLIGTFITNTLGERYPNHKPLQQVIKLTWANGLPTCKLGSDMVKSQCEDPAMHMFTKHISMNY